LSDGSPDGIMYLFWCPACKTLHSYICERPKGRSPNWTFNGDENNPTFLNSLLISCPTVKKSFDYNNGNPKYPQDYDDNMICHLFIKNGRIEYCTDCPHEFAGKVVDLSDIPLEYESD